MKELQDLLSALAGVILQKDKEQRATFLNDFKLFLESSAAKGPNQQALNRFISSYPWLQSLPLAERETLIKLYNQFISRSDFLVQLTGFHLIWDSVYSNYCTLQPEALVEYQKKHQEQLSLKRDALTLHIKPLAQGTIPPLKDTPFFLRELPLADDINASNRSDFFYTLDGDVFELPAGVGNYLQLGWIPPQKFIEAVISGRIYRYDYQTYRGSGGYMSTLSVSESERLAILDNSDLRTDGLFYHGMREGYRHYSCGYLFGLLEQETGELFAVVDGVNGHPHVASGTAHLAKFGKLIYQSENVYQPFCNILESMRWGGGAEEQEAFPREVELGIEDDGLQSYKGSIATLRQGFLRVELARALGAKNSIALPERRKSKPPLLFCLPDLGMEILPCYPRFETEMVHSFLRDYQATSLDLKEKHSKPSSLRFMSKDYKDLSFELLLGFGLVEEVAKGLVPDEQESSDPDRISSLIKTLLNEKEGKIYQRTLEKLAHKFNESSLKMLRNSVGNKKVVSLHFPSKEYRDKAISVLRVFSFVAQEVAVQKINKLMQKVTKNCNARGVFDSATNEVVFEERGKLKNALEASAKVGLECLDLASFSDAHTILEFSSGGQRDHAIKVLCENHIVAPYNLLARGDELYLSGPVSVKALYECLVTKDLNVELAELDPLVLQRYQQARESGANLVKLESEAGRLGETLKEQALHVQFMSVDGIVLPLMELLQAGLTKPQNGFGMTLTASDDRLTINFYFKKQDGFNNDVIKACVVNSASFLKNFLSWQGLDCEISHHQHGLAIDLDGCTAGRLQTIFEHNKALSFLFYSWLNQAQLFAESSIEARNEKREEALSTSIELAASPQKLMDSNLRYILANELLPTLFLKSNRSLLDVRACLSLGADPNLGIVNAVISANIEALRLLLERGGSPFAGFNSKYDYPVTIALQALKLSYKELLSHPQFEPAASVLSDIGPAKLKENYKSIIVLLCEWAKKEAIWLGESGELRESPGISVAGYSMQHISNVTAPTGVGCIDNDPRHQKKQQEFIANTRELIQQLEEIENTPMKEERAQGSNTSSSTFFKGAKNKDSEDKSAQHRHSLERRQ